MTAYAIATAIDVAVERLGLGPYLDRVQVDVPGRSEDSMWEHVTCSETGQQAVVLVDYQVLDPATELLEDRDLRLSESVATEHIHRLLASGAAVGIVTVKALRWWLRLGLHCNHV